MCIRDSPHLITHEITSLVIADSIPMSATVFYQIVIRIYMGLTLHQPMISHFDNSFSSAEAAAEIRVEGIVVAVTTVTVVTLIIL